MAIEVTWDNPNYTVLHFYVSDIWDWQDFYEMTDELYKLVKSVPHGVDVIIDLSAGNTPPGNALTHFQTVLRRTPHNVRSYVFVGVNGFQKAVLSVLRHIVPLQVAGRFAYAEDINTARHMIHNSRQVEMTG